MKSASSREVNLFREDGVDDVATGEFGNIHGRSVSVRVTDIGAQWQNATTRSTGDAGKHGVTAVV